MSASQDETRPGEDAERPAEIPSGGWWQIAKRVFAQLGDDHVTLVAAGVAFYAFLAIFPAFTALISMYGLVMSPEQVTQQVGEFASILPQQAQDMLNDILTNIASSSSGQLGWSLALSILLSVWSANKGTTALFEGLNIVYNEKDKRSFIKRKLLTLSFTLGAFLGTIVALVLIVGISALVEIMSLPGWLQMLISLARWPILALLFIVGLALAFRYAPHRADPKLRWVSVGSVMATLLWLVLSVAFAQYVSNFGNFNEVYGSLAAVVIMLLWLFLSATTVLLGAEINAEMEHQTSHDTTVAPEEPIGSRDAYYADHVPE